MVLCRTSRGTDIGLTVRGSNPILNAVLNFCPTISLSRTQTKFLTFSIFLTVFLLRLPRFDLLVANHILQKYTRLVRPKLSHMLHNVYHGNMDVSRVQMSLSSPNAMSFIIQFSTIVTSTISCPPSFTEQILVFGPFSNINKWIDIQQKRSTSDTQTSMFDPACRPQVVLGAHLR